MLRCGIGIDMRPFDDGRELVLGGTKIENQSGLAGGFDADVVSLAVCDAVLGAANLGDVNYLFAPDDDKYKDFSGLKLLEFIRIKLAKTMFVIENIDISLLCNMFDITPYKTYMAINIARALDMEPSRISIKSSSPLCNLLTSEKAGISAVCVCSLFEFEFEEEEEEPEVVDGDEEYYE